ncbi:MAG TPA: hypothetical protein DHD79_07240 [Firmicutes bacterium]|jgi:hypothetical protein|nr:hypothetical protein [Bacillota bacterium]HAW70946.1 hypothetical protein [Bacillota bacterium]HBE06282.1 hypothetical protein [Bacillota bacterium]HBG43102.1 hypothetical protein [Bacillota bacterium]HBL51436.1 hypothetical protein [Bacillota bacterium]
MHLYITWIRDSWEVKKVHCSNVFIDNLSLEYYSSQRKSIQFLSDYINDLFREIKSFDLSEDIFDNVVWTENWFKEIGVPKIKQCGILYLFGSTEKREAIDNSIKAFEYLVNDVRAREEEIEQKVLVLLDFIYDAPFTIESGCNSLELSKDLVVSLGEFMKTQVPQEVIDIEVYAA